MTRRIARTQGDALGPVVVITGASSGIGRATANSFAARRARLVLAARDHDDLLEVAEECRERGASVLVVPTDISDEAQVEDLTRAAVERFGGVDVWVGAASVFSYGTFEKTPSEVFRQIVDTNFHGQVYSARSVLRVFRDQGFGTLIFVGSIYSRIPMAYVAPYVAAKHALLGFTEVLRAELRDDPINVCVVLPGSVDTPIYQRAANYAGRRVLPLPPTSDPWRVARAIVSLAKNPRRVVVVGWVQRAGIPVYAFAPRLYERFSRPIMERVGLGREIVDETTGTVFGPQDAGLDAPHGITGGWHSTSRRLSMWVAALAALALLRRLRARSR